MTAGEADANREVARTALEQVCSRGDMTRAPECYAEDFADHVGSLEYYGLVGVERSTAFGLCSMASPLMLSTRSPRVTG